MYIQKRRRASSFCQKIFINFQPYSPPCPWDTHYQFSIKTLLSRRSQDRFVRPKIERYFLESFFRERNFGRSITCLQLCSHYLAVEWIHISPNYNICRKTFSRPLFQKEASEIWGCSFVSKKRTRFGSNFPPEWATISSRSISRDYLIT